MSAPHLAEPSGDAPSEDAPSDVARELGEAAMRRLRRRSSCAIEPGLTEDEFAQVEGTYGFRLADDHRAFLTAGLPVNTWPEQGEPGVHRAHAQPWPDWRSGAPDELRAMLERPIDGVLFDVENNSYWNSGWGSRPEDNAAAVRVARDGLAGVPRLVPVYGHRFLPAGAGTYGHPVLSVWQTDVIAYGLNLADYIEHEFGGRREFARPPQSTAEFWRDLL
jgi:hypothetical protein